MGDLISRKQLIREVMKWVGQAENGTNTESLGMVIDRIPTAYDVEKVVEQLEECKRIMISPVIENCFHEECTHSDCCECSFDKAIEIVRKGGGLNAD